MRLLLVALLALVAQRCAVGIQLRARANLEGDGEKKPTTTGRAEAEDKAQNEKAKADKMEQVAKEEAARKESANELDRLEKEAAERAFEKALVTAGAGKEGDKCCCMHKDEYKNADYDGAEIDAKCVAMEDAAQCAEFSKHGNRLLGDEARPCYVNCGMGLQCGFDPIRVRDRQTYPEPPTCRNMEPQTEERKNEPESIDTIEKTAPEKKVETSESADGAGELAPNTPNPAWSRLPLRANVGVPITVEDQAPVEEDAATAITIRPSPSGGRGIASSGLVAQVPGRLTKL